MGHTDCGVCFSINGESHGNHGIPNSWMVFFLESLSYKWSIWRYHDLGFPSPWHSEASPTPAGRKIRPGCFLWKLGISIIFNPTLAVSTEERH